jgi:hypothetical protein
MTADPRTDVELLNAARSGDEGALALLIERHRDRLERMVRLRMTGGSGARRSRRRGPSEATAVLGIKPSAAVYRYVRAIKRLKHAFQGMPGGIEGI